MLPAICIVNNRVYKIHTHTHKERKKDLEMEMYGQVVIKKDQMQHIGVHLLESEIVFGKLNGIIVTDQTRKIHITSQQWNQYIMVLYNFYSNVIITTGVKRREGPDLLAAYKAVYKILKGTGIKPVLQWLDNEATEVLIAKITVKGIEYQLTAPYDHCLNPKKWAIQSFKNHIMSNLKKNHEFPASQWFQILEQCEMTLNMLQKSRISPKLSVYTQRFGVFDCNSTLLEPIGTK